MRIFGLTAAALAMSLAGPAVAAMDDEKKTNSGNQTGSQQQSTTQNQQGSGQDQAEQPVESPTTSSQSGTGNQGNTSNAGSATSGGTASGSGTGSGSGSAATTGSGGGTGSGSGSAATTGSGSGMGSGSGTGSGSAATGDQGSKMGSGEMTQGQDAGKDANEQASLSAAQGQELIGKTLVGANDQEVGEISDVVVNGSELKSVLINVGGFLGMGDKTVAIPADKIQVQGDKVVASGLTKESAENMSEYKKASGG